MPQPASFSSAKPIWPEGRELEKNLLVGFRAVIDAPRGADVRLQVAASTLYRAFVNGQFLGWGPARAAHGFYRVDEWPVVAGDDGMAVVAIEVAGYNVNSYAYLDQPSFLQAEVSVDGEVVAATGGDAAFDATILSSRVQKVQRYSFQRPFVEVYKLEPRHAAWRSSADAAMETVACAIQDERRLLPRGVPYPTFESQPALWSVAAGLIEECELPERRWQNRSLTDVGPDVGGYPEDELDVHLSDDLQRMATTDLRASERPLACDEAIRLDANTCRILDLGTNLTGFIGATVTCGEPVQLVATFDEILIDGDVDSLRNNTVNAVRWDLEPGEYQLEAIEPYTLRYLKLAALGGACEARSSYLREYTHPEAGRAQFAASDRDLMTLFEAGRQTFAQNSVDIFMDCPGRERAGWLCDSFFTARAALDLTGNTSVERNFVENFLLPERFDHLPDGMLPMCYPADHYNGNHIPQWAMWFVVQLEEYLARSGDREMIDAIQPRITALLDFLAGFVNDDGLLESLPGWNFVEWSKANELVQDVSYPTNMLYAAALDVVGRLYGRDELAPQASAIREEVLRQSFDGEFFVDNAVRQDGELKLSGERTEICQYSAFFFRVATPDTHAELWRRLIEDFGPRRDRETAFPEVHPANAFIGYYLRMELLSRHGLAAQLLDELRGYFLPMAERTGTLWEHNDVRASCNHGFASHVCHIFLRDILGLADIDAPGRRIEVCLPDLPLDWCRGALPVGDESIDMEWWREGGHLHYRVRVPIGFTVDVTSAKGVNTVRHA